MHDRQAYYSGNLQDVQKMLSGDFGSDFRNFPERLSSNPKLIDLMQKLILVHQQLLEVAPRDCPLFDYTNPPYVQATGSTLRQQGYELASNQPRCMLPAFAGAAPTPHTQLSGC